MLSESLYIPIHVASGADPGYVKMGGSKIQKGGRVADINPKIAPK